MPDYLIGPMVAVMLFLLAQVIVFFIFLWHQALMLRSVKQTTDHIAADFARYDREHKEDIDVLTRQLNKHSITLGTHDRVLSRLLGTLNITIPDSSH